MNSISVYSVPQFRNSRVILKFKSKWVSIPIKTFQGLPITRGIKANVPGVPFKDMACAYPARSREHGTTETITLNDTCLRNLEKRQCGEWIKGDAMKWKKRGPSGASCVMQGKDNAIRTGERWGQLLRRIPGNGQWEVSGSPPALSFAPRFSEPKGCFCERLLCSGGGDSPLFLEEKGLCCYNNLAVALRQICFLKSFKEN